MLHTILTHIHDFIASGSVSVYSVFAVILCGITIGVCGMLFTTTSQPVIRAASSIMMFAAGIALFSGIYLLFFV